MNESICLRVSAAESTGVLVVVSVSVVSEACDDREVSSGSASGVPRPAQTYAAATAATAATAARAIQAQRPAHDAAQLGGELHRDRHQTCTPSAASKASKRGSISAISTESLTASSVLSPSPVM